MQRSIIAIISLVVLVSSGFCQVDTLRLVEINSIETPAEITDLYTESFRDNIQEIFICTHNHVYVYDSQTNDLLWTSPELINPEDLIFEDINNDGFKDISVKDSLNIFLFDVVNSQLLWTSPPLDSTYKCYTIGDRNDDGWIDVAIVSKEPFTRYGDPYNLDTVWVELFNGPSFQQEDGFVVLMSNVNYWPGLVIGEYPINIIIGQITKLNQLQAFIFLFSAQSFSEYENFPSGTATGRVWLTNGASLDIAYGPASIGLYAQSEIISEGDSVYLFFVSRTYGWIDYIGFISNTLYANYIGSESAFCIEIWSHSGNFTYSYNSFVLTNISDNVEGIEFCLAVQDSMYVFGIQPLNLIWTTSGITEVTRIFDVYNSDLFFDCPQIMYRSNYQDILFKLFNGNDGSLTSVLLNHGFLISSTSDLDSDGNDELLSIQDNSLHIYHLEQYVDISNPEILPHSTFILPNYPNPFNASTTIEFGLHETAYVTVEIFDLLGRKVETIISENRPAGFCRVTWNASDKPSGIYFYKIQAGEFAETKKMLLLK